MKYKKIMLILITAIFLVSIAGVCAADANDTLVASEDTSQIELSDSDKVIEDNLQTSEENDELTLTDNDVLCVDSATYSDLASEIGQSGNVKLTHKNYTYNTGATAITITEANKVIDGDGAVIDMAGSTIRAFTISTSGVTIKNLTIKNANYNGNGGAIYFSSSGTVTNCNFTGNTATGDYSYGGAIYIDSGTVTNCNFTNNTAWDGGAVYFSGNSDVTNCNFADNTATHEGGAIRMYSGSVENCNFVNNSATGEGSRGGAIRMYSATVSNCNFTGNNATTGSAIYLYKWDYSDTLTVSDSTFLNNRANAGALDIVKTENNITITFTGKNNLLNAIYSMNDVEVTFTNVTYWGANGIANTGSSPTTPSRSNKEAGQNITVGVVVNGNLVLNKVMATDENGTIVLNINAGDNYYITAFHDTDSYYTAVEKTISNMTFTVNATSQTTTNKTVNITAKSNIYSEVMPGKLLFILPNNIEINATYASNGAWWAVYEFDDYADYQVNASYIGLSNVTVTNATISIVKANSTVNVSDVVLNYGEAKNVTVTAEGATGITAKIDGVNATVDGYAIMIPVLNAGTYTLTVTTIVDENHTAVTKTATITVNKLKTQIAASAVTTTYNINKDLVITLKDSNGNPIGGLNITVDFNGTKNYTTDTNGQVRISTMGLAANIYDVGISFNGTDKYLNSSNTTTVSIYKESSRVDTKPLTTDYNVHKYLVVGLKDNEGNPIRNADASIEIHGVTYKCRSDDAGDARLIIRLNPGTYTAKITFDNVNYTGFTQYVTVIVKKLTPKLTAKKKTFKKSKKVKKYTVTLKANNKALAKVKLTLKVKGKTYKAKTNAKGKAVFKIKNLKKKGKYKATAIFKGDKYYNKVTKKVKITIK